MGTQGGARRKQGGTVRQPGGGPYRPEFICLIRLEISGEVYLHASRHVPPIKLRLPPGAPHTSVLDTALAAWHRPAQYITAVFSKQTQTRPIRPRYRTEIIHQQATYTRL